MIQGSAAQNVPERVPVCVFIFFFYVTLNDCRCTRSLFFFLFNLLLQAPAAGWKVCSERDRREFWVALETSDEEKWQEFEKSSFPAHLLFPSFPLPPSLSLSCSGTERGADGPSVIQRGMFHVHLAQAQIPPAGKLFSGQPPVIRGWSLLHSTA